MRVFLGYGRSLRQHHSFDCLSRLRHAAARARPAREAHAKLLTPDTQRLHKRCAKSLRVAQWTHRRPVVHWERLAPPAAAVLQLESRDGRLCCQHEHVLKSSVQRAATALSVNYPRSTTARSDRDADRTATRQIVDWTLRAKQQGFGFAARLAVVPLLRRGAAPSSRA